MAKKLSTGDVVRIPIDQVWFAARVIYLSAYFKNCMFIEITGPYSTKDASHLDAPVVMRTYTAARKFSTRGWEVVGTAPVRSEELDMMLAIVGSEVWRGDEVVRPATKEDLKKVPIMGAAGFIFIENKLRNRMGAVR